MIPQATAATVASIDNHVLYNHYTIGNKSRHAQLCRDFVAGEMRTWWKGCNAVLLSLFEWMHVLGSEKQWEHIRTHIYIWRVDGAWRLGLNFCCILHAGGQEKVWNSKVCIALYNAGRNSNLIVIKLVWFPGQCRNYWSTHSIPIAYPWSDIGWLDYAST